MFTILAEEIREVLPQTEKQTDRFNRAVNECGEWGFVSLSDVYGFAAVEVTTKNGAYFTTQLYCTCKDYANRIFCATDGNITHCKHMIGAYACGELAEPEAPAEPTPAVEVSPFPVDGEGGYWPAELLADDSERGAGEPQRPEWIIETGEPCPECGRLSCPCEANGPEDYPEPSDEEIFRAAEAAAARRAQTRRERCLWD